MLLTCHLFTRIFVIKPEIYCITKTALSFIIVYKPSLKNSKYENVMIVRYSESHLQVFTFIYEGRGVLQLYLYQNFQLRHPLNSIKYKIHTHTLYLSKDFIFTHFLYSHFTALIL